jgi:hypothetical protein
MAPFRSKSQAKWMFANKPEMAAKWAREYGMPSTLPEHTKTKGKFSKKRKKLIHPQHPSLLMAKKANRG